MYIKFSIIPISEITLVDQTIPSLILRLTKKEKFIVNNIYTFNR